MATDALRWSAGQDDGQRVKMMVSDGLVCAAMSQGLYNDSQQPVAVSDGTCTASLSLCHSEGAGWRIAGLLTILRRGILIAERGGRLSRLRSEGHQMMTKFPHFFPTYLLLNAYC